MMVQVEEREYARLLGYPWGSMLEGVVRDRAEAAAEWYRRNANPRMYRAPAVAAVMDRPYSGNQFTVCAVTAGAEVDAEVSRLWDEGRVDEAYFLDRYAACVVETLAAQLGSYESPGTGRIPFEEQWALFSYIAPMQPAIEILPSGMLKPKNSLLAIVRLGSPTTANACTRCDLAGCTFRRRSA